ncbi:MAG: hypothetical protein COB22_05870 [Cycloclasticus sp.]|nr:MAG: hypothetical protein COB22_05870 [Cycloclasticus sp.]
MDTRKGNSVIAALIPAITGLIGKAIDKAVPDADQAMQLKHDIIQSFNTMAQAELKGSVDIILAEASGESWLQRNWRPLLMLWFAGLVGAHWLGFTPDNLTQETISNLLDIVQVGIGGYVMGRSGEKIMKAYKAAK